MENGTATREEILVLPFDREINTTIDVPLLEHGPSIGGFLVSAMTTGFCLVLILILIAYVFGLYQARDMVIDCMREMPAPGIYAKLSDDATWMDGEKRCARLFWEGTSALLLPWLAAALGCLWLWAQHSTPPPWLLLVLAGPAMARAVRLEVRASRCYGGQLRLWKLLKSKLELFDSVSDGLTIAAAVALSEAANERFAESFGQAPMLQTSVGQLGLAGLLTVALAFSTAVQASQLLSAASSYRRGPYPHTDLLMPDQAGLGSLADGLIQQAGEAGIQGATYRVWISGITRGVAENAPQMLLQTSVLMAKGSSLLEQPTVLLSVLSSVASLALEMVELAKTLTKLVKQEYPPQQGRWIFFWSLLLLGALGVSLLGSVLGLTLMKLTMIELCPERLWGLSTGCVEMPQ